MTDTCETKRTGGLFFRLTGAAQRDHMAPYKGEHDEPIDSASFLQDVKVLRRVEIVVTGDPERVQRLGSVLTRVQRELTSNPNQTVDMRVTAFMDDCLHSTGWSTTPHDIRSELDGWHCYESETRLAQAFRATAAEHGRRGKIDSIILVANRLDEPVNEVRQAASSLNKLSIALHALVLKPQQALLNSYKQIVAVAKGHAVPINTLKGVGEAMPMLMYSMFPNFRMQALPAPDDPGAKQLRLLLAAPTR